MSGEAARLEVLPPKSDKRKERVLSVLSRKRQGLPRSLLSQGDPCREAGLNWKPSLHHRPANQAALETETQPARRKLLPEYTPPTGTEEACLGPGVQDNYQERT